MSPTFQYSFNESLDLYVQPLEPYEYFCGVVHASIFFFTVFLVNTIWNGSVRKSSMVHFTLLFFSVSILLSLPPSVLNTFQVFTPNFIPAYLCETFYGLTLCSNYLVFYARQDVLYSNGMADFLSEKRMKQRDLLVIFFKLSFIGYFGFCLVLPFIRTVYLAVTEQDETSQGVRVVFYHPVWLRIFMVLGDTTISMICLFLFLIPVIAFETVSQKASPCTGDTSSSDVSDTGITRAPTRVISPMSRRLQQAAYRNLKWTFFSSVSTLLFFSFAHTLQWKYHTLWSIFGGADVCVKAFTIMKISQANLGNSKRVKPSKWGGRVTDPSAAQKSSAASSSVLSSVVNHKAEALF